MKISKKGINQFHLNGQIFKAIDGYFEIEDISIINTLKSMGFEVKAEVKAEVKTDVENVEIEKPKKRSK